MFKDDGSHETKLCLTIPPDGKGRPYRVFSTDADGPLPQFVPARLKNFYDINPESFKTRIAESDYLTQHGMEFFATDKGSTFLDKLADFAKNGKQAPGPRPLN